MSLSKGITILLIGMMASNSWGQQFGFSLPQDSTLTRIGFNVNNNVITMSIGLNGRIWLTMIVDTSTEHTIISNKELAENNGLQLLRQITLGTSQDGPLIGYSANSALLELHGGVHSGDNHSVMVLEYDFLGLSTAAQTVVHGVIGRDLFGRFVVGIDNDLQVMTLWEPAAFQPPSDYDEVPIKFDNGEAKINIITSFQNWEESKEYYVLKTGAPHTILYDSKENIYNIPFKNIETILGRGSTGELKGHVGRTRTVQIGKYEFEEPVTSFTTNQIEGQNRGSIGMGLLSRFNFIVDYPNGTLYLKPNRTFDMSFEFDMSGIKISPQGEKFLISFVQNGSPAAKAGIQVDDQVLAINGVQLTSENFTNAISVFASKPDKKITLKIIQRGLEMEVTYRLMRFI